MEKQLLLTQLDTNIDIMQSSLVTNARFDISRMEMQIFIILVMAAQHDLKEMIAKNISEGKEISTINKLYTQDVQVAFSLNGFPVDMSGNEQKLKIAAENLVKNTISTYTETGWIVEPLLSKVEYIKKNRLIVMDIKPSVWNKFMDIRLGYSEFESFTAFNLKSKYSVRFYMMASSNLGPREITIDELKKQFLLENKYTKNSDFLKNIVYPAQSELDEKASVSFTATPYKKKGTKEWFGIIFSPHKNLPRRDTALEQKKLTHGKVHIGMALDEEEIFWLTNGHLEFTKTELSRNFETFNVAKKIYGNGLIDAMQGIYDYMLRKGKGGQKGYFIKALKENINKTQADPESSLF